MIDSAAEISALFAGSLLAGRQVLELPILKTDERAFVLPIEPGEMEAAWRVARGQLPRSGRWPVAVLLTGDGKDWASKVRKSDLFSRFEYENEDNPGKIAPQAIIAAAAGVKLDVFLRRRARELAEEMELEEFIETECAATHERCGSAPSPEELDAARLDGKALKTVHDLDRWLLDWEQARGIRSEPDPGYQTWFQASPMALLLLPTGDGWNALAYMHWYAAETCGSKQLLALGRSWSERYGAELVAHFGTMLQCLATRPPQTLAEAWVLAREHDLVASSTLSLPGVPVRDHARYLLKHERWFLHERP